MSLSRRVIVALAIAGLLPTIAALLLLTEHRTQQLRLSAETLWRQEIRLVQSAQERVRTTRQSQIEEIAISPSIATTLDNLSAGRPVRLDPAVLPFERFQIVRDQRIVWAANRPGLTGDPWLDKESLARQEFTADGPLWFDWHFATVSDWQVWGGEPLSRTTANIGQPLADRLTLITNQELGRDSVRYAQIGSIITTDDGNRHALVAGGNGHGYTLLLAEPDALASGPLTPAFLLIGLTVIIAMLIGWFLLSRTRREVDNLVAATQRIGSGDYHQPVMAFEEGEFQRLADALDRMQREIRLTHQQLAIAERIAAWEEIGRKVAHEVRNPLTPIDIAAADLRTAYADENTNFGDTLEQSTTMIRREIRRVTKLLDEFVQFARMRPANRQPTGLASILSDIEELFATDIASGRVTLTRGGDITIVVDRDQLTQVLINLVKNGLEASPDSRVCLDVTRDGTSVVIHVTDTGPGFPSNVLADPFTPRESSKATGSGLGLLIAQRIITDHAGTITLANTETGAMVTISLPGAFA